MSHALFGNVQGSLIAGGTFILNDQLKVREEAIQRLSDHACPQAAYNSLEPLNKPRCHPGTRKFVLGCLKMWLASRLSDRTSIQNAPMLFLTGEEGMGKSAVAQTFAETCASERQLLATFSFCAEDPSRNHIRSVVSSFAFQITVSYPSIRHIIADAIREDRHIFDKGLDKQFDKLLATPLRFLAEADRPSPGVMVIDGLDQCVDPTGQVQLVNALSAFARRMDDNGIRIRILITARSTPQLETTIAKAPSHIFSRFALEQFDATADICLFLIERLRLDHPTAPDPTWPDETAVTMLAQHANGSFCCAVADLDFISGDSLSPSIRLAVVIYGKKAQHCVVLFFLTPHFPDLDLLIRQDVIS